MQIVISILVKMVKLLLDFLTNMFMCKVTNELESSKEECKVLKERLTCCEEISEREKQCRFVYTVVICFSKIS